MPIEFNCPSCQLRYRVKDELAGKGAKCGKCGHRMRVPQAVSAAPISEPQRSAKPAAPQRPAPVKIDPKNDDLGSWLNDELEVSTPVIASAASRAGSTCTSCGSPLAAGAVLCVACGFDARTGTKHETRRLVESAGADGSEKKKRTKLGSAASLLRGTFFSFCGAMLGALIWAVIAYLTSREIGFVAWGLGGLAGLGMALGHEDDDGTFAGIIAAFMSLGGIVAAKILIVVIVVAAIFGNVGQQFDPVNMKRIQLAGELTDDKLRALGIDTEDPNEEQWEKAFAEAEAEVAQLSEQELDARLEAIAKASEARNKAVSDQNEGKALADTDGPMRDRDAEQPEIDGVVDANVPEDLALDDGPSKIAMFFKLMFSPVDGIFILLAFFTAYKVGSGTMTD